MIKLIRGGVYYTEGKLVKESVAFMVEKKKKAAIDGTLSYSIIKAHNKGGEKNLRLKFDNLVSGGSYGEILQCVEKSGITEFPKTYTFSEGQNSDRAFALAAAKKYGGNFVPSCLADARRFVLETEACCGEMILSSDGYTGFGAIGAMSVCGCGGELFKQLLNRTYDTPKPSVIAVYLKGKLKKGVGPNDVALALIGATYKRGFLRDGILEFIGPGIKNLSMDYRLGIDAMTFETGCLTTVWETDDTVREFYRLHQREGDFKEMHPADPAYYDSAAVVDLSRIEPMIAFSPSETYTVKEFIQNADGILDKIGLSGKIEDGKVTVDSGEISGLTGGSYENLAEAAEILKCGNAGTGFPLFVSPNSQAVFKGLADNGYVSSLLGSGACFLSAGAPCKGEFSIRHTVGWSGNYAIMDARSIAATALNGGVLTPATEADFVKKIKKYKFDGEIYKNSAYKGFGNPQSCSLCIENAESIPDFSPLAENIVLRARSNESDSSQKRESEATDIGIEVSKNAYFADFIFAKTMYDGGKALSQREEGVLAVVAGEYASVRYRSDLINWGIIPFICRKFDFKVGDFLYIENIKELIKSGCSAIPAKHISDKKVKNIMLEIVPLTEEEKIIILSGSLINYNRK